MNALFTHFFDDLWTCRKWSIQIIGIAIFIIKHIDHGGNMAIQDIGMHTNFSLYLIHCFHQFFWF